MGYDKDQGGTCGITNEITLAGVFGQYTSLKTGIQVVFPCNPERFEAEAEKYHGRVVTAIQKFQNKLLSATGREIVWKDTASLPLAAAPTDHGLTLNATDGPPAPKRTRRPRRD